MSWCDDVIVVTSHGDFTGFPRDSVGGDTLVQPSTLHKDVKKTIALGSSAKTHAHTIHQVFGV